MNRIIFLFITFMSFSSFSFANEEEKVRTTEDFNLNGKVKSEKSISNGRLLKELKFRSDGRLKSEIIYSKTNKKERENTITYDDRGYVVKNIQYDYTLNISKSDSPNNSNQYLEDGVVYSEERTYNDKNQEIERVITSKEQNEYSRKRYIYEYNENGLLTKENCYNINLTHPTSDTSVYSTKQHTYFDNNQKQMVIECRKGKGSSESLCDTTEIYDQQGNILYQKLYKGVKDDYQKNAYDKKGNLVDIYTKFNHTHNSYTKKGIITESKLFNSISDEKDKNEAPYCITKYDEKGRVINEEYKNGEYVSVSYDEEGYAKVEQYKKDYSLSSRQFGQPVIENKILNFKDKNKVDKIITYEYDLKGNVIKSTIDYMRENRYIIDYYE